MSELESTDRLIAIELDAASIGKAE